MLSRLTPEQLSDVIKLLRECEGLDVGDAVSLIEAKPNCESAVRRAALEAVMAVAEEARPFQDENPSTMNESHDNPSISGYTQLNVVGRGGQAKVFRAWSLNLQCEVAIKLSGIAIEDSPVLAMLFDRERRALLQLQHEHIAPIRDAGKWMFQGKNYPFLVTAWVNGVTLEQYVRDKRATLVSPSQGHSSAQAQYLFEHNRACFRSDLTRVFLHVARALHYCHARKDVQHLDISPRNIMIIFDRSGNPEAQVVDFGMSIPQGNGGAAGGTVAYMSPEIADALRQTGPGEYVRPHRPELCDVFSLGVVMYEAFTGKTPFAVDTSMPIDQQGEHCRVRGELRAKYPLPEMSQSPSFVDDVGSWARPLSYMLRKAICLDTAQRYQSAHDLGDDLQHLIQGALPRQYRATFKEQWRQTAKRQKMIAWMMIALTLVAIAAAGFLAWKFERDHAEQATAILTSHVDLETIGTALGTPVDTEAIDRLLDRRPDIASLIPDTERAVAFFSSLGRAALFRGRLADAEHYLNEGVGTATEAFGESDPATLAIRHDWGQLLVQKGELDAAATEHSEVLNARRSMIVGTEPIDAPSGWLDLARSLGASGDVALKRGDAAKAEERFREARTVMDQLHEIKDRLPPKDREMIKAERALALSNLVAVIQSQGFERRDELAELWDQLAVEAQVWGTDNLRRLIVENNLGHFLAEVGRLEEAERVFEPLVEHYSRFHGDNHPETLRAINNLAVVKDSLGRSEAGDLYRDVLDRLKSHTPMTHPDALAAAQTYASWLIGHDRSADAQSLLDPIVQQLETVPPEPIEILVRSTLGRALNAQSKFDLAIPILHEAQDRWKSLSTEPPATFGASIHVELAEALWRQGRFDDARTALAIAKRLSDKAFPPTHRVRVAIDRLESEWR